MNEVKLALFMSIFFGSVYACISPENVQFHYTVDLDALKESGQFTKMSNKELQKEYKTFVVGANEKGIIISCKQIGDNCLDSDVIKDVLQKMENLRAFDLSKEDKDTISSLYEPHAIIKEIPKQKVFGVKLKARLMQVIGKLFCTHYEELIKCQGKWCSLKEMQSEECPMLNC